MSLTKDDADVIYRPKTGVIGPKTTAQRMAEMHLCNIHYNWERMVTEGRIGVFVVLSDFSSRAIPFAQLDRKRQLRIIYFATEIRPDVIGNLMSAPISIVVKPTLAVTLDHARYDLIIH